MPEESASRSLKERVRRVLAEEVAPIFRMDGTGIEVVDVVDGVVQVRVHDVCCSCPSSAMTLIMGMEQELRQRIPEVEYLEAVP